MDCPIANLGCSADVEHWLATEDPSCWIYERGENWVKYVNTEGERWAIYGICNQCGECEVGGLNPNIRWTGLPVGQPGACIDVTFGKRLDNPVRPEIKKRSFVTRYSIGDVVYLVHSTGPHRRQYMVSRISADITGIFYDIGIGSFVPESMLLSPEEFVLWSSQYTSAKRDRIYQNLNRIYLTPPVPDPVGGEIIIGATPPAALAELSFLRKSIQAKLDRIRRA